MSKPKFILPILDEQHARIMVLALIELHNNMAIRLEKAGGLDKADVKDFILWQELNLYIRHSIKHFKEQNIELPDERPQNPIDSSLDDLEPPTGLG